MLAKLSTRIINQKLSNRPISIANKLQDLGINPRKSQTIYHNLSYPQLEDHYLKNKEGIKIITPYGKVQSVDTGKFTGRSPKDRWLVANQEIAKNIWWGDINRQVSESIFNILYTKCVSHYNRLDSYYLYEGHCGANPETQKNVSFLTEYAWQHHFVKNMFIESQIDNKQFQADFTIINASNVVNDEWIEHGLNSEIFIIFNLDKNIGIIGGTHYGGCMKKGIFSLMNYHLPLDNIMTMHCSANVGEGGDTALFFGLSGTGKTTLSADPKRKLIGDDEHGWDEGGIFNLEGGCYAKTINLTEENEPDIFRAIKPNALLENIWYDEEGCPDYTNTSKTENGRVSYPLIHIDNLCESSRGGHPEHIIFLTCDAFGVLPPISRLNNDQAMYHFISGYTAKVAGTERGVNEPQATFSAGFGAAFLPLHPSKYADLLSEKLEKHGSRVWLVNTGWTGGPYGVGERMSIKTTRSCIDAILSGSLNEMSYRIDPVFGFVCPMEVDGVDSHILNPVNTWDDMDAYREQLNRLVKLFQDNYQQFKQDEMTDYSHFGPRLIPNIKPEMVNPHYVIRSKL